MRKYVLFSIGLIAFMTPVICLAADPNSSPLADALPFLKSWPEFGKVIAFAVALQIFLRGIAEALTRIADYTENTFDNKLAAICAEASWFLGALLGKIGYGEPKLVTAAKVDAETARRGIESFSGAKETEIK